MNRCLTQNKGDGPQHAVRPLSVVQKGLAPLHGTLDFRWFSWHNTGLSSSGCGKALCLSLFYYLPEPSFLSIDSGGFPLPHCKFPPHSFWRSVPLIFHPVPSAAVLALLRYRSKVRTFSFPLQGKSPAVPILPHVLDVFRGLSPLCTGVSSFSLSNFTELSLANFVRIGYCFGYIQVCLRPRADRQVRCVELGRMCFCGHLSLFVFPENVRNERVEIL